MQLAFRAPDTELMALAGRSICLPCNESISDPCSISGLKRIGRFQKRRVFNCHGIVLVKIRSNGRKSRCSQLMRSYRNYHEPGLRCSNLLSGRREKFSSISSHIPKIPEVVHKDYLPLLS